MHNRPTNSNVCAPGHAVGGSVGAGGLGQGFTTFTREGIGADPFKLTAGATPPDLIGRTGLQDEFEYGLQQGSGAPGLLTIITGSRGIGKTVMLSAAEGIARSHGWAVISQTANPGFLARIGDDMLRILDELGDGPPTRRITAFSAAGFGLTRNLQLVGYYLWMAADRAGWVLDEENARAATTAAQRRNTLVVVESALSDISGKDREFLEAMAAQEGPSAAAQIGQIMKSKPNVVSKYRNRLIAAGLIESAGYGKVHFAIPGLRQYLRQ